MKKVFAFCPALGVVRLQPSQGRPGAVEDAAGEQARLFGMRR
jgi:hypothetical protein